MFGISHFHYIHHHINREITELYISTAIRGFAAGMLILFTPLYFYTLGISIERILIFVAISYALFASMTPFGAALTARFGHERAMAISTPLIIVYFIMLYFLPHASMIFYPTAIILGIHNALYWVAYHSEFARFSDKEILGKEIGLLKIIVGVTSVLAPAVAGIFVDKIGFSFLFVIAAILILASLIPMLKTPEPWKRSSVNVRALYTTLINFKNKKMWCGYLATGEDVIASTIWPIFIFLVIPSYKDVGILTTVTTLLTFLLFLWIGNKSDAVSRPSLIAHTSVCVTISWILRMFAFTPFSIFFSDAFYKLSSQAMSVPLTAFLYCGSKRNACIEYTACWISMCACAKMCVALLAFLILLVTDNLIYTFLLAGVLSLLYLIWNTEK